MAFRKEEKAEVEVEVEIKVTQDHHPDLHLLSTGKVKVIPRQVARSPIAVQGAAVTLPRDSSTTVLVTKVPRCEVTRNQKTINTRRTNHGNRAAGARRVPGAGPGSAPIIQGSTRRRVTTTEITGMNVRAPTSEQAIAMTATILGTAGIGDEQ